MDRLLFTCAPRGSWTVDRVPLASCPRFSPARGSRLPFFFLFRSARIVSCVAPCGWQSVLISGTRSLGKLRSSRGDCEVLRPGLLQQYRRSPSIVSFSHWSLLVGEGDYR